MTDYATSAELATYLGAALGGTNAGNAPLSLTAASRGIESVTGRDYTTGSSSTASTRRFHIYDYRCAYVDDFYTTDDLVVALDTTEDGTPDTTITLANYELYPLNGRVIGIGAVSYTEIRLIQRCFYRSQRPQLHVTAHWGWAAVPDLVKRATLMLAADMLQDPSTPFGVMGLDQLGAVRVRNNGRIMAMIQPLIRAEQAVMVR